MSRSCRAPPGVLRAATTRHRLALTGARRTRSMSGAWNEGYCNDTGYTYEYYRETSAGDQRFCLLLRGLACDDPGDAAAHCELGFGQGVSVNINAAANPGQYVATDFNPAHAAHAIGMARGGDGNLRLFD